MNGRHGALIEALDVHMAAAGTQAPRTPCSIAARPRLLANACRNVTGSPFR